jgi:serine/threonine-protein kinase HipA
MTNAKENPDREAFEVYLDAEELNINEHVGQLYHNLRKEDLPASFEYAPSWFQNPRQFKLDPRLEMYKGEQFPAPNTPGFGMLLDSAPDRWGRVLMERREAAEADRHNRQIKVLREIDFLLGVHDATRMDALRFRRPEGGKFLDDREHAAPLVTSLPALAGD